MLIASATNLAPGLALFLARLIQLQQFHSILILYDDSGRNLVEHLPKCIPSYSDVAWSILNIDEHFVDWTNRKFQHKDQLIISAIQISAPYDLLRLYYFNVLDLRSKNIILINQSDPVESENVNQLFELLVADQINAIFLEFQHDSTDIYAWNPPEYKNQSNKLMLLSELEFFPNNDAKSKYSGLFFDNVQSGKTTEVVALYDPMNVYNVIGSDGKRSLSGTEMNIIDVIGKCIRSKMNYIIIKQTWFKPKIEPEFHSEYVEKTYYSHVPVHQVDIKFADSDAVVSITQKKRRIVHDIITSGIFFTGFVEMIYPHSFENYIVVVPNIVVNTPMMLHNIVKSPTMILWILLTVFFALLRCFGHWIDADQSIPRSTHQKMCMHTCQETVYLSFGVLTHLRLYKSRRYRQLLLVHGATIVPMLAGMYFGGLLYGQFLLNSEEPLINSIKQLEQSGLNIVHPTFVGIDKLITVVRPDSGHEKYIERYMLQVIAMIWAGNTTNAYIIPERWISILEMEHLCTNGRSMFHVIEDRFAGHFVQLQTSNWWMLKVLNSIMIRLHEHGIIVYFVRLSQRTYKPMIDRACDHYEVGTAQTGGFQELQIAFGIFILGMFSGMCTFWLEIFWGFIAVSLRRLVRRFQ